MLCIYWYNDKAGYLQAYKERNAFIVTQAPLKKTIEDFWIMVANYDVRTIVMLNDLQEDNEVWIWTAYKQYLSSN